MLIVLELSLIALSSASIIGLLSVSELERLVETRILVGYGSGFFPTLPPVGQSYLKWTLILFIEAIESL